MLPVLYSPSAEKYFRRLREKALKEAFHTAIQKIRKDPSVGASKTGDLKGLNGYDVYYNGTNYEIAYRISKMENGKIVVIILAGTRENFYKELKRHLK